MRITFSIILIFFTILAYAQIDIRYNRAREGDEILKQQVEYKDPGRSGENVIWNFGSLKSIDDQYSLIYTKPVLINKSVYILGKDTIRVKDVSSDDLIVGTEHNTMYYYRIYNNQLWLLGHENPTTLLHYEKPLLMTNYPTNYGDSFEDKYNSKGVYSSRVPFGSEGQSHIEADAYGMMVLPSGDTLNHVMRIKTIQTINTQASETRKSIQTTLETYKWYVKGYRYPVFETIKRSDTTDKNSATKNFATSFFFPPQDHFYLDSDAENLAVLDSLWNIGRKVVDDINLPEEPQQVQLTYNFYPNPVETYLNIEYYLDQSVSVNISIYSMDGRLVNTLSRPNQMPGMYTEQIDCSNLSKGTYILRIQASNTVVNEKILKK